MNKIRVLVVIGITFLYWSCNSKTSNDSLQTEDFFANCNLGKVNPGITVFDSIGYFSLTMPKEWETEVLSDSDVKGLYGMDIDALNNNEVITSIIVNNGVLPESISLEDYFKIELKGLTEEGSPITKTGKANLSGQLSRWLLQERNTEEGQFLDFILYAKNPQFSEKIVVIHISTNENNNQFNTICPIISLVLNSFNFEKLTSPPVTS